MDNNELLKAIGQLLEDEFGKFRIIGEGHKGLADKINRIDDKTEEIAETVLALDIIHMKR